MVLRKDAVGPAIPRMQADTNVREGPDPAASAALTRPTPKLCIDAGLQQRDIDPSVAAQRSERHRAHHLEQPVMRYTFVEFVRAVAIGVVPR